MQKDQGPQGTQVFSRDEVDRLLDEARDDTAASDRACLRGLSHSVSGKTFSLDREKLIVGRAESCSIRIDESSVSSEHARLALDEQGWRVVNLLSTNGTFVNDERVSSARLGDGDHVRFGRVEFQFLDADSSARGGERAGGGKGWLVLAVLGILAAVGGGVAYWWLTG